MFHTIYEKKLMTDLTSRTWAEISLENIRYNCETIRASLPAGTRFLGVVKADAYGHGAVRVAETLEQAGADYLAVACLSEALELREAGIRMPILILGHTPAEYAEVLADHMITQSVSDLGKACAYSEALTGTGKTLTVHIKVDTGMSRLGFLVSGDHMTESVSAIAEAVSLPGLRAEGIFTHFAVSDEPGKENREYTLAQFGLFMSAIEKLGQKGITFPIRHCANTGATIHYPEMALDMVRPGLLLYGYGDDTGSFPVKPCMTLKTRVAAIKEYDEGTTVSYGRRFTAKRPTRVAVLCAGYADGLPRLSSGKCSYLTELGPAPQVGSICMDMCMIDITDLPASTHTEDTASQRTTSDSTQITSALTQMEPALSPMAPTLTPMAPILTPMAPQAPWVREGSVVEIFGEHAPLTALSDAAMTIPYELLCAVSKRVPRIYTSDPA